MEFECPVTADTSNAVILVAESNANNISNDVTGNNNHDGATPGPSNGIRRRKPEVGERTSGSVADVRHANDVMTKLRASVGTYLSDVRDHHSASGEDMFMGPSNEDVYNSSVPYHVDRTSLALATSLDDDMSASSGVPDIGRSTNDIDITHRDEMEGPVGPMSTSKRGSLSRKALNHMVMSKNVFNVSRGTMGDMDRLVATLHDHDEYEALFDPSPDKNPRPKKRPRGSMLDTEFSIWNSTYVFVRVIFLKIGRIDTANQTFKAEVYIEASWREKSLDGKHLVSSQVNWDTIWLPQLYVVNMDDDVTRQQTWHRVTYNKRHQATIVERRRVSATFTENMELRDFPFDTQNLTVTVASERQCLDIQLESDTDHLSYVNTHTFSHAQEWFLCDDVSAKKHTINQLYRSAGGQQVAYSVSCAISRRPGFFIVNTILLMMLITFLTFTTFTVDLKLPQNRLFLTFILFLNTIAFKLVVAQSLPNIPYLTSLDKYVLVSMSTIACTCLWHGIVVLIDAFSSLDGAVITLLDRAMFGVLLGSWILFQTTFILYVYIKAKLKRRKMSFKMK